MKGEKTIIIGLTGSIGSGKSTCAAHFSKLGAKTIDTDKVVHHLLAKDAGVKNKIKKLVPASATPRGIDRTKLGAAVFADLATLKKLESILHPAVFKQCRAFIAAQKKRGAKAALIEMPLLFETGYHTKCDVTICVSVTKADQQKRVLARKGFDAQRLARIRKAQMSQTKKIKLSDFVIKTTGDLKETEEQVKAIWQKIVEG